MYGGAERVIKSLCRVFNFDKCYTLIDLMTQKDKNEMFSGNIIPIEQSYLKHFGSKFRALFPFFYNGLKTLKIDTDVKVIISSSHAVSKGIQKSSADQIHISYFQARNQKYLWDDYELYFGKASALINPFKGYLQKLDIEAAQKPDYIISNSNYVQKWVKMKYNRDSVVIYPPVDLSRFSLQTQKEDYFVAVGRMEPYKRFDLVVEAFNKTNKKLIVIGDGSQLETLKKRATKNIEFKGFLDSNQVYQYISKAKAFIHAGIEDFGIAPIEAQACGTPVIAYGKGGVLETVIESRTGLFFNDPTAECLLEEIEKLECIKFDYALIRKNAERFETKIFEEAIKSFVNDKLETDKI